MDFTQNSLLKFHVCYSSWGRHKSAKAVCKFSSNSCPRFTEHNRALIFMRLKEFLWVLSDLLRVVGNLLLRAFIMSAFPKMLCSPTLNRGSLLCVHFFSEAKERVRKNYEDEGKGKMKDFISLKQQALSFGYQYILLTILHNFSWFAERLYPSSYLWPVFLEKKIYKASLRRK